jgi:hypothetical protein
MPAPPTLWGGCCCLRLLVQNYFKQVSCHPYSWYSCERPVCITHNLCLTPRDKGVVTTHWSSISHCPAVQKHRRQASNTAALHSSTAAQQHSSTAAQQHSSTAAQQHSSAAAQQHSSAAQTHSRRVTAQQHSCAALAHNSVSAHQHNSTAASRQAGRSRGRSVLGEVSLVVVAILEVVVAEDVIVVVVNVVAWLLLSQCGSEQSTTK